MMPLPLSFCFERNFSLACCCTGDLLGNCAFLLFLGSFFPRLLFMLYENSHLSARTSATCILARGPCSVDSIIPGGILARGIFLVNFSLPVSQISGCFTSPYPCSSRREVSWRQFSNGCCSATFVDVTNCATELMLLILSAGEHPPRGGVRESEMQPRGSLHAAGAAAPRNLWPQQARGEGGLLSFTLPLSISIGLLVASNCQLHICNA